MGLAGSWLQISHDKCFHLKEEEEEEEEEEINFLVNSGKNQK